MTESTCLKIKIQFITSRCNISVEEVAKIIEFPADLLKRAMEGSWPISKRLRQKILDLMWWLEKKMEENIQ